MKRCELENLRLNVSSLSILMFAQDPERARAEKSAHLDYEIKRMKEQERKLKEDVKQLEMDMESSMEVSTSPIRMLTLHPRWYNYTLVYPTRRRLLSTE